MISIVGMSTLRGKALGFFAIYWIIYVIVKYIKFKNNTDSDLKLLVEVTNNKVIAKILKIEY